MTVDFKIAKKNLNLKNEGMGNFHFQKMIKIIYQNEKGFNSNSQLTFKPSEDKKISNYRKLYLHYKRATPRHM